MGENERVIILRLPADLVLALDQLVANENARDIALTGKAKSRNTALRDIIAAAVMQENGVEHGQLSAGNIKAQN